MDTPSLAGKIDHTLLKPEATPAQVDALVDEALRHGFASVCVNGCYLARAVVRLHAAGNGHGVRACAVAGFPLGSMTSAMKAGEAQALAGGGADEVDFVAHLPHLLHREAEAATRDMATVVKTVRNARPSVVVKVILETAALMAGVDDTEAEARLATACESAARAGCDFVKTSTGFHPAGGATRRAVELLKRHAGGMQVKAAGGIRTRDDAEAMLVAGADRLGCSAGVAIVSGGQASDGY